MTIAASQYRSTVLNTAGAANSGSTTDTVNLALAVGSQFLGPTTLVLTASTQLIPGLVAASSVAQLTIRNTGSNPMVLDMKNQAAASSQLGIAAGGEISFFNTTTSNAVSQALVSTWTLASALGTTCLISWVA